MCRWAAGSTSPPSARFVTEREEGGRDWAVAVGRQRAFPAGRPHQGARVRSEVVVSGCPSRPTEFLICACPRVGTGPVTGVQNGGYFAEITDVPAPSPTIRQRHLDGVGCIIIHDRRATGIRASAAVAAHRVDGDLAIGWPGNRS